MNRQKKVLCEFRSTCGERDPSSTGRSPCASAGQQPALRDLSETFAGVHATNLPPRLLPQHGDEVPQELQENHPYRAGPRVDAARSLRQDPLLTAIRQARDAQKGRNRATDAQEDQHPAAGDPTDFTALPHGFRMLGAQRAAARVEQPEDEYLPDLRLRSFESKAFHRWLRYPSGSKSCS